MIVQLIATNRPGSNTAKVAAHVAGIYAAKGAPLHVVDLHKLPPDIFAPSSYAEKPASFAPFQDAMSKARGFVVVTPEYNGGFPGVFKYFIDMLEFPGTFTGKPFAFVGLSAGMGGAVRPIEQFSTLVTYLRGIIYPGAVNIPGIHGHLNESDRLKTPEIIERIEKQADGFLKFVEKVGK
ncbi:MAG TPA: NAD(P)H-dependent oxidoreductase [Candidatus Methylacidiphilales bacterium]|jgi:NAD(P)H-dependent FMN reductase|nr:NAD(P)H-dependent oxidoreductase [Candidatus Methylacidiphilales bacterium]